MQVHCKWRTAANHHVVFTLFHSKKLYTFCKHLHGKCSILMHICDLYLWTAHTHTWKGKNCPMDNQFALQQTTNNMTNRHQKCMVLKSSVDKQWRMDDDDTSTIQMYSHLPSLKYDAKLANHLKLGIQFQFKMWWPRIEAMHK